MFSTQKKVSMINENNECLSDNKILFFFPLYSLKQNYLKKEVRPWMLPINTLKMQNISDIKLWSFN